MLGNLNISQEIDTRGICVVIPTYNNAKTLAQVVDGVLRYTNNIIVVNDGSTDDTPQVLTKYSQIDVVNYPNNQGKGVALSKGFRFAIDKGFKHAITIDSDGQHNPDDIPLFVQKLVEKGDCLIIGVRNMDQASVPGKSNFGRKFSNFWFRVETGIDHEDTQSGFRLYPLAPLKKMAFVTTKFEFEIELIVRLAWKGTPVESVPVSVIYFDKKERVSHFRPGVDFTRISILNTFLVFLALIYFRPMLFLRKKKLSEHLYNPNESSFLRASSIAFGVFMGIIPIWGFQLAAAILLAFLFKLNKPLVIISANISIPPMIPPILFLSMVCGSWWVDNPIILNIDAINIQTLKPFFIQYLYGSITLAVIASLVFGMISYASIVLIRKKR